MDIDGSNLVKQPDNTSADTHPTLSPNGRQIAFLTYRFGLAEICVMDIHANNLIILAGIRFSYSQL